MPSNTLVGALRVEATLDAGKFIDGARRIQASAKQTESSVKSSFTGIGNSIKAGIAGFVGSITIGAVVAAGKAALDYAGHLGELADTLGLTTKDLQEFSFAAGQVGISQEELQVGIQKLTVSMGQAELGAKKQTDAFKAVGLSVEDLKGKNAGDVFRILADRLADVTDRSQRAAIEVALFGKAGAKLDNLLSGSQGRLSDLADAAQKLGIVLSDEQIQNADRTADKIAALQTVLKASIAGAVADNAASIYKLIDSLAKLAAAIPRAVSWWKVLRAELGAVGTDVLNVVQGRGGGFVNPLAAGSRAAKDVALRNLMATGMASFYADTRKPTPAGRDLPKFLSQGGGSKKAAKGPEDQSADDLAQYAREQMQADQAILQAKQQLAGSADQRAAIEVALIKIDHDIQAAELDEQVRKAQKDFADKKITAAALQEVELQTAGLKAKNDQVTQLKLQAFVEEQLTRQEQAQFDAGEQARKFALDALHAADDAATTEADHRRIQLQILDAEIEQQRLELQHAKDLAIRNGATKTEIDNIQARIDNLPNERAQGAAAINRNTRSPLEAWGAAIPKTSQDVIAALQNIETQGLDQLSDALTNVVQGTESLKQAFHDVAASILADLLKMTIKMMLFKAITAAFGGGSSSFSSGAGGALDFSSTLNPSSLAGFATGGSILIGGRSGTDKNLLSLNGMPIARVSMGERINISNDNDFGAMGGPSIVMHNDFRGASPEAVAAIKAHLDQLETSLPGRVAATMKDVDQRTFGRWQSK